MHATKCILFFFIMAALVACTTAKKSITTATPPSPQPTTNTNAPFPFVLPENEFPAPGNDELFAIQAQFKDVTLEKLKEGHLLYTQGACTNCHAAKNIYPIETTQWKSIIDDMAPKAYLTDVQKDAVYKYVLAVKAKQTN